MKRAATAPLGSEMPLLEVGGVEYGVGNCILRYVCKLAGFYPEDGQEAMLADAICDQGQGMHLKETAEDKRAEVVKGKVTEFFGKVEAIASKSKTGWICGGPKMSNADLKIVGMMCNFGSGMVKGVDEPFNAMIKSNCPCLRKLHKTVMSEKALVARYGKDKPAGTKLFYMADGGKSCQPEFYD